MSVDTLLQALASGILLGLIYAAMSFGLSLTMGILGIVNVAHSTFILLGGFLAFELATGAGIDPALSMILAAPVFFAIGVGVELGLVRRLHTSPPSAALLVLFGVLVTIESAAILVWTTDTKVVPTAYGGESLSLGQIALPYTRLIGGGMALVAVIGAHLFMTRTLTGKAIRALAQNRDAARIMGVDVKRLSTILFGLGTAAAGVGGVALSMVFSFAPQDHIRWLALAFLIVILGGLGSVRNTLVAALLVGVVEAVAGVVLPFRFVLLFLYAVLALVLMVRGQGLLGAERRTI